MPRVQRQVDSRNETGEGKGAHSLMTLVSTCPPDPQRWAGRVGESRWQASECTDTLGGRSVRIRKREMRDSEHVSFLSQDSCRSECTRCKGVLTQWLSAAAVADCSRHVWTNQGQICEAHRGALAHAHKTTGLSLISYPVAGTRVFCSILTT